MLIDKTDTSHSKDPAEVAIDHVANSYDHIILHLPSLGVFDFSITKHVFLLILVALITVSSMIFWYKTIFLVKRKCQARL